jgi:hypothetical protein
MALKGRFRYENRRERKCCFARLPEMPEEAAMNMLNMQTKEKVNKIHLAEMQQNAHNRHLVRALKSTRLPAIPKGRIVFALIVMLLVLSVGMVFFFARISF